MSRLKATYLRNESAGVDNIVLNSDGSVGGELGTALAAKAPTASPTFTGNVVWSGATLRASTAEVLTGQSTTSTTYVDLATAGPAVTVTTGTKALVILSAELFNNTAGSNTSMSFAISGASTVAASDNNRILLGVNGQYLDCSFAMVVTGLTAGSNTFTAKYKTTTGTATFSARKIIVIDLGS